MWKKYKLHWLTALYGNDLTVYLCLNFHANADGWAWPAFETLMTETGLPRSSVYRALQNLEKNGWVEKHQFTRTEYLILDPTQSKNRDEDSQKWDDESQFLDKNSQKWDGPILTEKNQEKNIEQSADEPREENPKDTPLPSLGDEFPVKITNIRRDKTEQDETSEIRHPKDKQDYMRAVNLAQHLTMYTRRDCRNYIGAGQVAAWQRLLALHGFERTTEIIDEAMAPRNRQKLEAGDRVISAHSIEYFAKLLMKPKEEKDAAQANVRANEELLANWVSHDGE